jgi:hypothetical protein
MVHQFGDLLELNVKLRCQKVNIKKKSTWCSLCVECFVRISEQTAAVAVHVII